MIEDSPYVLFQHLYVVASGKMVRLPFLGGHVTDIHLQGPRGSQGLHDAWHKQIGKDAGIKAPRPSHYEIRIQDRLWLST